MRYDGAPPVVMGFRVSRMAIVGGIVSKASRRLGLGENEELLPQKYAMNCGHGLPPAVCLPRRLSKAHLAVGHGTFALTVPVLTSFPAAFYIGSTGTRYLWIPLLRMEGPVCLTCICTR
jgi:hypothetical protein